MDNKINEKNLSTNMIDLIDPSEKYKIDEYLQFLKCYKCNEIMIEPRQCFTCNYGICQKCKMCTHNLSQSRHIKSLLESISFKCKFHMKGCPAVIKYPDVRQHLLSCRYADEKFLNPSNKELKSSSMSNFPSRLLSHNLKEPDLSASYISLDQVFNSYKISDYEGKVSVKCYKCDSSFHNKSEFIQHIKLCNPSESENNKTEPKDELLSKFYETHESFQKQFAEFIFDKIRENKNIALRNAQQFESLLLQKKEAINNFEKLGLKFNNEDYLKEDPEIQALIKEESCLNEEIKHLIENFNKKIEEMNKMQERNENVLKEELDEYKNSMLQLELEERWAKEDLEATLFANDFGDRCTICGNEESGIKKYLCQNCRGRYCVDKCCKQCKHCSRYICPKDSKKCQLCQKPNYCESCQKGCFFQGCSNTFCPECFKRNEHQARNSHINCKFFTCERDQVCDCLMTSLFCPKCEKRLCNKCLMSDKEHFPFLK